MHDSWVKECTFSPELPLCPVKSSVTVPGSLQKIQSDDMNIWQSRLLAVESEKMVSLLSWAPGPWKVISPHTPKVFANGTCSFLSRTHISHGPGDYIPQDEFYSQPCIYKTCLDEKNDNMIQIIIPWIYRALFSGTQNSSQRAKTPHPPHISFPKYHNLKSNDETHQCRRISRV